MDSNIARQISGLKSELTTILYRINDIKKQISMYGQGLGLENSTRELNDIESEVKRVQSKLSSIN